MFQTKIVEKRETHMLCSVPPFPPPGNRAAYEIMWKNVVERGRPQICRMRIACWIPKATNTRTGCAKLTAFPLQQWLYERASMLRYTYSTLPVFFDFMFELNAPFVYYIYQLPLHVSSNIVLIIRRIHCIHTASGSLYVTLLR